ncbi:MAG: OmpA family protein [Spirochaetales bacterium]|nr:OmpA family protein [Spirochaetales bacterium]
MGIGLSSAGVARLPVLRPKGRLKIEPDSMFSPDGDGENDELFISYRIPHRENVVSAVLRVLDQNGHPFRTWGQLQEMAGTIVWKGLSDTADGPPESVSSASDYTIELETVDILGRTSVSRKTFRVDVLVVKDGDTYKIRIPSIQFPPNSADFTQLTDKTAIARNKEIISRLAAIFLKFPEYRITIAGHANSDYFDDIDKMQAEQEKVLIPLSYSRAEMVRDMLIQAGVRPEILRVSGYGAALPLVPFQDKMQRWKNRRVEFILEK